MTPWVDMGPAEVDDTDARMYQLKNMAGEKVNTYTFYIGKVRNMTCDHFIGQVVVGSVHVLILGLWHGLW